MDNLLMDNRMLHEDIDDFKKALHQIMNKYRELKVNSTQRELELEKLKNMRIEFLEQQMKREKEKSHKLILQNIRLKEKYLELINKLRQNLYEYTEDEKEDNILLEQLVRENRHLRELLAISKLSDPKVRDIETALLTEEKAMNQMSIEQYREQLMAYKQERESRKRSKSMADIKSKNFLVGVQSEHSGGSDVWSSFFKKHETGAASSLF